jgi:hypothetical protein
MPKGEVYWGCGEDECMDCKDTGYVVSATPEAEAEGASAMQVQPCPSCGESDE